MFYETLLESGLVLEEPEFKERTDEVPGLDYENKDFYQDRQNVPFPPDVNKLKRKAIEETLKKSESKK